MDHTKASTFEEFKAGRAQALKAHLDKLPTNYFGGDYLETEGTKTPSVRWIGVELAKLNKRLTKKMFGLCHTLSDTICESGLAALGDRCRKLEDELAALKANPPTLADSYKGIWQPGSYERGAVCTNRGSLWLCIRATTLKPGAGSADETGWQMIVKAGKDGRDADTRHSLEAA